MDKSALPLKGVTPPGIMYQIDRRRERQAAELRNKPKASASGKMRRMKLYFAEKGLRGAALKASMRSYVRGCHGYDYQHPERDPFTVPAVKEGPSTNRQAYGIVAEHMAQGDSPGRAGRGGRHPSTYRANRRNYAKERRAHARRGR